MAFAIGISGIHFKRVQQGHFGVGNALDEAFFIKTIHQKPDRAVIHAEYRLTLVHKAMQRR